jgi:glycosyltransferase involved in cell wall biosynthesis
MKIYIVTSGLHVIGGAQLFVFRLANALKKRNFKVAVVTIDILSSPQISYIKENLATEFSFIEETRLLKFISKINYRLGFSCIQSKLIFFIQRRFWANLAVKFDEKTIINSHLIASDIFLSKLNLKNKVVSCPHGEFNLEYLGNVGYNVNETIQKLSKTLSGIIHLSEVEKTFIPIIKEKNNKIKSVKIYNGIDFEEYKLIEKKFNKLKSNHFTFVMVARGEKSKGWEEAIGAFLLLKQRHNIPTRLILIGDSDYLRMLKNKYILERDIIFTGYIDPRSYLSISDCFLFPTYFPGEALPNVLVEAMAFGLPIITSDIAEIPCMITLNGYKAGEIIELDKDTGKVSIDKLSDCMFEYISDSKKYLELKSDCIKVIQQFNMDYCINSYINFFKSF